jgi:hypothetical protein
MGMFKPEFKVIGGARERLSRGACRANLSQGLVGDQRQRHSAISSFENRPGPHK